MKRKPTFSLEHPARVASRITTVRDLRVMLDADIAAIYGVETRVLNQAVRRNRERFPPDFAFVLTAEEFVNLKSQSVTSSWGGRRKLPMAFTEHGALMAASVLNSPRAIEMSQYVVRAFVQLREVATAHGELARKLDQLERRVAGHDKAIGDLIRAIRQFTVQPEPKRRPIGFITPEEPRGKEGGRR